MWNFRAGEGTRVLFGEAERAKTGQVTLQGHAESDLVVEVVRAEALFDLPAAHWDDLTAHALDPNPFYARPYLLAGLETLDRDTRLRALLVRTAAGQLVGLFPFRLGRLPPRVAVGAVNIYQMCGHPLIHRQFATQVTAHWFAAMRQGTIPRRWRFPHVDLESGFALLCGDYLQAANYDLTPLSSYPRPRLRRLPGGFEVHANTVLAKGRLKELQRTLRRLREAGEVQLERVERPEAVRQRIEDFLAIEHAGWKGEAGTSFLAHPEHARFLRAAVADNAGVSIDSLLLDGRPIALSINLQAGALMFTPKCAYDEAYRRFSPGLILEYLVIERFYASTDPEEMDAATTVGGHLVQGLWNEQRTIGMVLVGPLSPLTRGVAAGYRLGVSMRQRLRASLGDGLVSLARRIRRHNPELWARVQSFGQMATCLVLYI